MLLTQDETKRLDKLFGDMWSNRTGVNGSWGGSANFYYTYIRRGPLLLVGKSCCEKLSVLYPADCKVTHDSSAGMFPIIQGEEIAIRREDGPWWDYLREELPKMEAELAASNAARRAAQEAERSAKGDVRAAQLKKAASAFQVPTQ